MHIHHIVPQSKGGSGEFENGIPVCLDCHAEIESKSNMGRHFSPEELRAYRDGWFKTVKERPEVLIRAAQAFTETGPLQALLAELDVIGIATMRDKAYDCPPLPVKQFERSIATNALAALDEVTRETVQKLYVQVMLINHNIDELMRMQRVKFDSNSKQLPDVPAQKSRDAVYNLIRQNVHTARSLLSDALGQNEAQATDAPSGF
jgi:hypothetical protein